MASSKSIGLLNIVFGADLRGFDRAMKKAQKSIKKFGSNMKRIGGNLSRNLTLPILAVGGASVKMALDFEQSMTKINTLVGVSKDEVEKLKKSVLELSGKTATAPNELADGLYFLTSAGLSSTDAMEALEQVSKGVASGLGESADLSNVAAAAQNAYGKETMSASKALDIFGGMVKTGMFNASELASVLGTQLGLSASLGISFEEVGALIATYTKTTGDANAATTGLSGVMMSFAKITPKQETALNAVGLSAKSLRDMLSKEGLQGTLLEMQKRFKANGIELSEFFSKSQSLKAVLGVLGNQTKTYKEILLELESSVGFVNTAFDETAETSSFKMKKALNDLTVAGTMLGEELFPVVDAIAKKISKLATWFSTLADAGKKNVVMIAGLIAVMGPLLMIIGQISIGISALIPVFAALNAVIAANPIGTIVVTIAALVGAFYWLLTSSSDTARTIRNAFIFMANGVIDSINLIIEAINLINPFEQIKPIKQFAYESEIELEKIEDGAKEAAKEIEKLTKSLEDIPTGGEGAGGVGGDMPTAMPVLGLQSLETILPDFKPYGDKTRNEWERMMNDIEGESGGAFMSMKEQAAYTTDMLVEDFRSAADKIKKVLAALSGVFTAMNEKEQAEFDIWKEGQEEKTDILDDQMEAELERVEESGLSDEAKAARKLEIEEAYSERKGAIDDRIEKKEKDMKRKQAIRDKAMKIASAIMSTAEAVASVIAFPPLAALVGALGAIQISTIASTPIPFAQGGLVTGPTLGLLGEGSGTSAFNPEIVSPLDKLMGMMGATQVDVHGRIQGDNIVLVSDKAEISRQRFL
jgi:TP901 family phage tail tape measure protein